MRTLEAVVLMLSAGMYSNSFMHRSNTRVESTPELSQVCGILTILEMGKSAIIITAKYSSVDGALFFYISIRME